MKKKKIASSTDDVVNYWKNLKQSDLKEVTQAFATESRKMGLSDCNSFKAFMIWRLTVS